MSDPVLAAQLRAARQTLAGFLWGIAGIALIIILFCISWFARSYQVGYPPLFAWDGVILDKPTSIVVGIWPGSAGEKAGFQLRDIVKPDYTVDDLPSSVLPPNSDARPDAIVHKTVIRDGQPIQLTYTAERSTYPPFLLALYMIPTLFAFGCALWLLRRWGAEPALQVYFLIQMAIGLAMLSQAVGEMIPHIGDIPDFLMICSLLHFMLIFPEPVRYAEQHPRRLWLLYVPVILGLVEFLLGNGFPIAGVDINVVVQLIYAVALIVVLVGKWIRRDLKRYPGLWWMIGAFSVGLVVMIVVTINPSLSYNTIFALYGSRVVMRLIDFTMLSIGNSIAVILGSIAYHKIQLGIGPSLITQTSISGKEPITLVVPTE